MNKIPELWSNHVKDYLTKSHVFEQILKPHRDKANADYLKLAWYKKVFIRKKKFIKSNFDFYCSEASKKGDVIKITRVDKNGDK